MNGIPFEDQEEAIDELVHLLDLGYWPEIALAAVAYAWNVTRDALDAASAGGKP